MMTTRLFTHDQGQAVLLPREFQFEGKEIYIKRIGRVVMLIPMNDLWRHLTDSLDNFTDDFMAERHRPEIQHRS